MFRRALAASILAQLTCAAALLGDITSATLQIQGAALEVATTSVTTQVDVGTTIKTRFGGKSGDAALAVEGLLAVGELTGPGLDGPIQITTAPGFEFQIPGLPKTGTYALLNVRLMKGTEFVAPAVPNAATIVVADILKSSVSVRQLSADELRARGINLDNSWTAYDFSLSFFVDGQEVVVPFPIAVDPRTHEVARIAAESPYVLPPVRQVQPPRWSPPDVVVFDLPADEGAFNANPDSGPRDRALTPRRISVPAAIVIPNSLAALHEFFAVVVTVANGAPSGSTARLEDISGTIKLPSALKVAKSRPAVSFGQPVPIVDAATGVTFLVAQAKGKAEFDVEGLAAGTHTIDIEVRATLRENGQADIPLKATPRASVVVHDPRFNVTFSHPDVVRKGADYSTYCFLTNASAGAQTLRLRNGLPSCDQAPGANVCRAGGNEVDELTLASGEMRIIEYKLRSGVTGQVFATAGSVSSDVVAAAVELHMGVSESGIPLSPATLVLPYYAQFVAPAVVEANLGLLGLGYSLATAPVNQTTAKFPRLIRSDVFYRAVDIGRAGQRIFISDGAADETFNAVAGLTLDLLGNSLELREWDELRRREARGRSAMASVFAELNATGMAGRSGVSELVDRFAAATSYRAPFALAVAHGPSAASGACSIEVRTAAGRRMAVANEAASGWIRDVPFGEVSRFDVPAIGRTGEIAVIGRWSENVDLIVKSATSGPVAVELLIPAASDGGLLRAYLDLNITAGEPLRIPVSRGAETLNALLPNGGFAASASTTAVTLAPLQVVAARQDLHLDPDGHRVSVLFSRPAAVQQGADLRTKFAGRIRFNRDGVVYDGERTIFAAAMQEGSPVVNLSFDQTLTTNADYDIAVSPLIDVASGAETTFGGSVKPKIDNARPAGIIYGHFLKGDGTAIPSAEVRVYSGHLRGCQAGLFDGDAAADCNPYREPPQYSRTGPDGSFLFEYVPRDVVADPELSGGYRLIGVSSAGRFTAVDGAVRLPGRVHFVNLQLLGRGAVEGVVRYDSGAKVAGAAVFAGSTMFGVGRGARSDGNGTYRIDDLPVGPITLAATDADGNVAYAAAEIAAPGQLVSKDLLIVRRPFPGTGTLFGVIRRSDTGNRAAGVRVGVYSQGFAVSEALTDSGGHYEFSKVPAGFVTVLAADWSIGRESAAADFDLHADETREVNLTLPVQSAVESLATLSGDVVRENPLFPGDPSKYEPVAGALVKIGSRASITADANGHFAAAALPLSASGAVVQAYDPATKRVAQAVVPTLTEAGPNHLAVFIPANAYGNGTLRVKLLDAAGNPVSGFRVIEPGYPPVRFTDTGSGVYERKAIPVGAAIDVWAVNGPAAFGDQYAHGTARVEFPGQAVAKTLRLPGQGRVRVELRADFPLIDDVRLTYPAWDEAEQALAPKTLTASTSENGVAGYASFTAVPALVSYTAEANNAAHGYASVGSMLGYDGDLATHTLQLKRLASVRGTVYAIDGTTPIAGAAVKIDDGRRDPGVQYTQPDGTFAFTDVPSGVLFRVTADVTQSGIYRTGVAYGRTAESGGPVEGIAVVLRRRGGVEGRVVYADRRVDPNDPAKFIPDDTPGDLSDNAPVPLAGLWLRELDYPNRSFGSAAEPLSADASGRFVFGNVFAGGLRISAWDPSNQELRGDWTAALTDEGQLLGNVYVAIGSGGTGSIQASVVNPNTLAAVPNAEVSVYRGSTIFDLTSSDANGIARFEQLPAGAYSVNAYSKSLGKSGSSGPLSVLRDTMTDTRILLSFSGNVDGTLTDPESVPPDRGVAGAPVTLSGAGYQTRSSTAPAGAFSFDGVREGSFTLEAKDTVSNRRAAATRTLSAADPHPFVKLELERTETLHLGVYLPDDTGGDSGVLAGAVIVDVVQRGGDVTRSIQGNPVTIEGMLAASPYSLSVREIGGAGRQLSTTASFPKGAAADPLRLVWPAFGDVVVTVSQGGVFANGAKVTVSGGGRSVSLVTDGSGEVTAHGIPLGAVSAQAISLDGAFSGSGTATLQRQSSPAHIAIALGAYAAVTGTVVAEAGGPSSATRVVASFSGRSLENLTDGEGRYTFNGIPALSGGTAVALTFIGPDGVTIGGRQSVPITAADASRVVTVPAVRLDATPPQLLSVTPADGAQSVSPDSAVRLVFSEPIRSEQVTNGYLQLVPADGSGQVITTIDSVLAADGTFVVTMRPPPPPAGQRFPLRSNTLYRIVVSGAVEDLAGHSLPAARGTTFTTSDYSEPRVIRTVPPAGSPLPQQVTLQFVFNEPIDPEPWKNGAAAFHLYKVTAPRADAAVLADVPGRAYVDPAVPSSLVFAPDAAIATDSYYRAVFSGVHDLQGNALGEQTFYFSSVDGTKPFVTLVSPVPEGLPLISGVEYVLGADIRDGSATAPAAIDVAKVDYVRVDGAVESYLTTASKPPFAYRFVAPEAPPAGTTLTLRARATDTSSNVSDPATLTWSVVPNAPPRNVAIALPPPPLYPGNALSASVSFDDEGTLVSVAATMSGTRLNGSTWSATAGRDATRANLTAAWTPQSFDFTPPADADATKAVTVTATVTDVRGLAGSASATLSLTADTVKPSIVSTAPAAGTTFHVNDRYVVEAVVADAETGVAEAVFTVDGRTYHVPASAAVAGPAAGSKKFTSPQITAAAKNVDTRVTIGVTAADYAGNTRTSSFEVIYIGVNDPTRPTGAWLCPVDRAALPASTAVSLPLRVKAVDDIAVTSVAFRVPGLADAVIATRVASSDEYTATVSVTTPAAGADFGIVAVINDADPTHTLELPIAIDVIAVDQVIDTTLAITADNKAQFESRSIVVRTATGRLVPHVPVVLSNLLVLDGGRVESLATTTSLERKVDITVLDRLYVDCASTIDVTAKGYLGGWGVNADGSGTKNESATGRTAGNSTAGGASNAGGSHGGLGGGGLAGGANPVYDAINSPAQPGSGGAGGSACCVPGGAGGGVISLTGDGNAAAIGRIVIAGTIRADGGGGAGTHRGGAGGAVSISALQFIVGPSARVSANGGDAPAGDADGHVGASGGGGRIAVSATERLDVPSILTNFEARGGNTPVPTPFLRGGAGTIYVRAPGASDGALYIAAAPAGQPSRATPVGFIGSGTAASVTANSLTDASRTFDSAAIGEDVLFASSPAKTFRVTAVSSDRHTLTTDPADGDLTAVASAGSQYRGLVRFGEVHAGANALARFDDSVAVDGAIDVRASIDRDATAVLLLHDDRPSVTITGTTPAGPDVVRRTGLDIAADAGSPAGLVAIAADLQPAGAATTDPVAGYLLAVTGRHVALAVPGSAQLGPATLNVRVIDRADRSASVSRSMTVVRDSTPPSVSIVSPVPPVIYQEQPGAAFTVTATASDDAGVKSVAVAAGSAGAVAMAEGPPGTWTARVPVPPVDGTVVVTLPLTVTALDFEDNVGSAAISIGVQPQIEPASPPVQIDRGAWTADAQFRAQTLAMDGSLLLVSSAGVSGAVSDKLVLLDTADPAHPALQRAISTANGGIRDIELASGWAYVAADRLFTINVRAANSAPNLASGNTLGALGSVTVAGGYAYASETYFMAGRLFVFDVADPAAPRLLGTQGPFGSGGEVFSDLIPFGKRYMAALANDTGGRDLVIFDRSEPAALKKIGELQVANFSAWRGYLRGSLLYLVGTSSTELVVVDLAVPASPRVVSRTLLTAGAGGVRVFDDRILLAATSTGLIITTAGATPAVIGSVQVGGRAMDVAASAGYTYVANESGLAVLPIDGGPIIDASRVSLAADGTMVTVNALSRAVTGAAGITATVQNSATAASISVSPSAAGSFTASLPASGGDVISLKAVDGAGRTAGPVDIGAVPFGASSPLIPIASGDPAFRARTVRIEGTTAVVTGYPLSGAASSRLVIFDISGATPVQSRVITGFTGIKDVQVVGNTAYVAGDQFGTIDLASSTSAPTFVSMPYGSMPAVAVVGGYAYVAEGYMGGGRVFICDVSNPASPRYLSTSFPAGLAGTIYTDLIPYGSYLVGISNDASGRDVVILDRRAPTDLKKVAELPIPQISGFRGRISGSTLYVAGQEGGIASVDLSNIAAPTLRSVLDTPGQAYGIEATGSSLIVADRGAGVTFVDASGGTLRHVGEQAIVGDAWDVALSGSTVYVASDLGLSTISSVTAPPQINTALITVTAEGRVVGSAGAVMGRSPVVVEVKNSATSSTVSLQADADGRFDAPSTGSAGDTMTVKATDASGRSAGPVVVGPVPFGSASTSVGVALPAEASFRARIIKVQGTTAVVSGYPQGAVTSNSAVIYDISGATPVQTRVVSPVTSIFDVDLADGWAYFAGSGFATLDLRSSTSRANVATTPFGFSTAVTVSGGYAFLAESYISDGRVWVYDVSEPATPRFRGTQSLGLPASTAYSDLIAYGTQFLVGISNGASGRDVVVIDRRDVGALKKVAELQIPAIVGFRGRMAGSMLYVTGEAGGVAAVDLSNPLQPVVVSVDTPAAAAGIDVAGNTVVVAERGAGVAFFEHSATGLRLTGMQPVPGDAWDVAFGGTSLYVANDLGLAILTDVVAPPRIVPPLISTTTVGAGGVAIIAGSARSVAGQAPIQIVVTAKGGSTASATASADGSFAASVPAHAGESVTLTATDRYSRAATLAVGAVPFASVTIDKHAASDADMNFFAGRIGTDGTNIVLTSGTRLGVFPTNGSGRALLFRQANASEPPVLSELNVGVGDIADSVVSSGYAFVVGNPLGIINYAASVPVVFKPSTGSSLRYYAVAVSNGYAYLADDDRRHAGTIAVCDVRTPTSPALVRSVGIASGGPIDYRRLIPESRSPHLYAISPDANRDLTIISLADPAAPVRVTEFDVPGFAASGGALDGTTLYLTGGDAGVAVVDVSNPAAPQLLAVIDTPGIAQAVAVSGLNEIVVADSSVGLTFIATNDRPHPVIIGSQPLNGCATDVKVLGGSIYAATETRFYVLTRP